MTTRTWKPVAGGDDKWLTAANWAGGIYPQAYDTVVVSTAPYPIFSGGLSNLTVNLSVSSGSGLVETMQGSLLALVNTSFSVTDANYSGNRVDQLDYPFVSIDKGSSLKFISNGSIPVGLYWSERIGSYQQQTTVVNNGLLSASKTGVSIVGTMDNEATVLIDHSNLGILAGPNFITNNGALLEDNGSYTILTGSVQGTGFFSVGSNSTLEFSFGSVSRYEKVYLLAPFGPSQNATLRIDRPDLFHAPVYGFDTSDSIQIKDFVSSLMLYSQGPNDTYFNELGPQNQFLGQIHLVGNYFAANFALGHSTDASGDPITTIVRTS
jgi:hypothetical protein